MALLSGADTTKQGREHITTPVMPQGRAARPSPQRLPPRRTPRTDMSLPQVPTVAVSQITQHSLWTQRAIQREGHFVVLP